MVGWRLRVGQEDVQPNWFLVEYRKGTMNFSEEPSKRDLVKLRFQDRNIYTRVMSCRKLYITLQV